MLYNLGDACNIFLEIGDRRLDHLEKWVWPKGKTMTELECHLYAELSWCFNCSDNLFSLPFV